MGQQPDGPPLIGVAENQPEQAYRHCQKANLRPNIYGFGGNGRLRPSPVLPETVGQHQQADARSQSRGGLQVKGPDLL